MRSLVTVFGNTIPDDLFWAGVMIAVALLAIIIPSAVSRWGTKVIEVVIAGLLITCAVAIAAMVIS